MFKRHKVIYETRLIQDILSDINKERWQIKDSVSNKIWTLWVHCYVIWAEEYTDHFSTTN